jgi:glutamate-1-semialdehyde 2,1-aminomutase
MRVKGDISALVAEAEQRFSERYPESDRQLSMAVEVMPGGNTRSVLFYDPFPIVMARGEGSRLWDLDGHEYVDFLGEFTAGVYGHSHPVIREAIIEAVKNGLNLAAHNVLEVKLARVLCQRFPSIELVRFTNSGTEANLMALALARRFTRRSKILVFRGAYHGGLLSFDARGHELNAPYDFVLGNYNDTDGTSKLIDTCASELAAVIVEPMLGAGGAIPGSHEFLTMLGQKASEIGALLIFDEVMTSRLGAHGLQDLLGMRADLTTLGKYIGGGSSIGAFGGRADIMGLFDPRQPHALHHAGTFNNNVISMAAGAAGLTQVYTSVEAEALTQRGDTLRQRLNELCVRHGASLQFTGIGSIMNAHATAHPIVRPIATDARQQAIEALLFFHLLERGFYIARRGFIVLSLPVGQGEVDGFVEAVDVFLRQHEPLWAQDRKRDVTAKSSASEARAEL